LSGPGEVIISTDRAHPHFVGGMDMPQVAGSFCWFECGTTDLNVAREFYTKLFGWSAVESPMPGEMGGVYVLLQADGSVIAGMYELSGPQFEGVPSHWLSYVQVESADDAAAHATKLGARVLQAPIDVPGVGRMAYFCDPTGAAFAVFQPGEHYGADAEKSNLGWTELHTRDTAAAKSFYTELFGWGAKEDPSGAYTEFQVNGRSIGGMMSIPPEQGEVPPNWLLYALVDDCDATLGQATALGAKTLLPSKDIPNVGRFAVIADPTGAAIAIIKLTHH